MLPLNQMSRCLFPITELESYLGNRAPEKRGQLNAGCVNIYVHHVVFTISGKSSTGFHLNNVFQRQLVLCCH